MQTRTLVVPPRSNGLKYPSTMDDALPTAIDQADLPALVGRYYPDSGARPGRKGVVFAVWRGDEQASFSLFRSDAGRWLYRDHRTCESGNAFGFLTDICGLTRAEAAGWLKAGKGTGAGTGVPVTPTSAPRSRKVGVEPGEAVYDALLRAVSDKRIPSFAHPLSQARLSRKAALACAQAALETPQAKDSQDVLKAAHGALKGLAKRRRARPYKGKPVAYYDYLDAHGTLLYQVVRLEPKAFVQRRPYQGVWAWGLVAGAYVQGESGNFYLEDEATPPDAERFTLGTCPLILYRLNEVEQAVAQGRPVYIVEGEEDVHALLALGLTATCNSGGAGKWNDAYAEVFRGGVVYVLPDNDPAGDDHARRVAQSLTGVAKWVQLVRLPGLPSKGDVRDWLNLHGPQRLLTQLSPGH